MNSRVNNYRKKKGLSPGSLIFTGEQKTEKIKIDILQYSPASFTEKVVDSIEEIGNLDNQFVYWINVTGLHEVNQLGKIGEMFNLNSLIIEDILNINHSPKLEDHEKYIFMIGKMADYNTRTKKINIEQISFILGKNYLITFQEKEGDSFELIRERLKLNKGRIRKLGSDYLMYRLLDSVVDNYTIIILQLDELIEEIEDELLDEPDQQTIEKIYYFRKQANKLRRVVIPLKEIIYSLEKEPHYLINKSNYIFIKDLGDHVKSASEAMENYKDQVSHMIEIYRSTSGLKLNEIVKVLTIISTIFIPLTFIAGIYGMNFNYNSSPYNMPELNWYFGYPVIILCMIIIAVTLLIIFRKKRWI